MKLPIFLVFILTILFLSSQPKGGTGKHSLAAPVCKNFVKVRGDQPIPFSSRLTERLIPAMSETSARAHGGFLKMPPAGPHPFGVQMQSSRQTAAWGIT